MLEGEGSLHRPGRREGDHAPVRPGADARLAMATITAIRPTSR
ncbi:hypothetical protein ACRAWD_23125 [Caulobacter segnis]